MRLTSINLRILLTADWPKRLTYAETGKPFRTGKVLDTLSVGELTHGPALEDQRIDALVVFKNPDWCLIRTLVGRLNAGWFAVQNLFKAKELSAAIVVGFVHLKSRRHKTWLTQRAVEPESAVAGISHHF